jgi:hypothetical protein
MELVSERPKKTAARKAAGLMPNGALNEALVARIAETAHSAHWGLARSTGDFDGPPWQILPGNIKAQYTRSVLLLWEYPEADAVQFYEFIAPRDEQAPAELTQEQRMNYEIFRGVVEAFRRVKWIM